MKLIIVLLLCPILFRDTKGHSDTHEYHQFCKSDDKDKECGDYAYKILKPMMGYFEQVNREIDKNGGEMESKNNQIRHLQDKATQLRIEIASGTSKDKIVKLLEEKDITNAQLIKSLQHQIDIAKQADSLMDKQTREIVELKDQLKSDSEKVINCEAELNRYTELSAANVKRVLQLEAEVTKSADKSKEIESLKQEIEHINKSNDQLNKELTQLREKAKREKAKNCLSKGSPGVHNITLWNDNTFEVLCNSDIAGPGWNVIQQRIRGGVNFQRDWVTYRKGFGAFWDGDFFLGLEKIHRLTAEQPHELYIHMMHFNGTSFFARYDEFAISGEDDQYRLNTLGVFSGSPGTEDALTNHKYMRFSTYDRDNDKSIYNCAKHGGWWYLACSDCPLNGRYFKQPVFSSYGIFWHDLTTLKEVKMMIRPKSV